VTAPTPTAFTLGPVSTVALVWKGNDPEPVGEVVPQAVRNESDRPTAPAVTAELPGPRAELTHSEPAVADAKTVRRSQGRTATTVELDEERPIWLTRTEKVQAITPPPAAPRQPVENTGGRPTLISATRTMESLISAAQEDARRITDAARHDAQWARGRAAGIVDAESARDADDAAKQEVAARADAENLVAEARRDAERIGADGEAALVAAEHIVATAIEENRRLTTAHATWRTEQDQRFELEVADRQERAQQEQAAVLAETAALKAEAVRIDREAQAEVRSILAQARAEIETILTSVDIEAERLHTEVELATAELVSCLETMKQILTGSAKPPTHKPAAPKRKVLTVDRAEPSAAASTTTRSTSKSVATSTSTRTVTPRAGTTGRSPAKAVRVVATGR
jgi:hypothetical protein